MPNLAEVQILGVGNLSQGLSRLHAGITAAMREAMQTSVLLVESEAKAKVPRRSGRLFSSIQSSVSATGDEGHVGTDVEYAPYVEMGTRAHEIAPVTALALMVPVAPSGGFGGGRLSGSPRSGQQVGIFARVHHPGTSAKPYLEPALKDNEANIQNIFAAAIQRLLGTIKGV